MNHKKTILLISSICFIALFAIPSFSDVYISPYSSADPELKIAVSIEPFVEWVEAVGKEYKHILSHQVITARFLRSVLPDDQLGHVSEKLKGSDLLLIDPEDIVHYPVPRLIEKFLEENRLMASSGR